MRIGDDEPTVANQASSSEDTGTRGTGRLMLAGAELRFEVDTCYEGEGVEHSPDLRVDVEGKGVDGDGRAYTVQVIRTHSDVDQDIDVIRLRYTDQPPGSSYEAQRVHDRATGDVNDLWGDETTPLLELTRTMRRLTVVAREAVFGHYPGGGTAATLAGIGELDVTCNAES